MYRKLGGRRSGETRHKRRVVLWRREVFQIANRQSHSGEGKRINMTSKISIGCLIIAFLAFAGSSARADESDYTYLGPGPSLEEMKTTHNRNAADTTNTDQIWGGTPLNLTGAGYTVGVWDAGDVLVTHQEFGGRVTIVDGVGTHYHSTHVAGTIGAAGVVGAAQGMASQVNIRSRDWDNDITEMAGDAAAGLIQVSNHSYGNIRGWTQMYWEKMGRVVDTWYANRTLYSVEDPNFGKYTSNVQSLDQVLYDNPKLVSVWSASNDRNDQYTGLIPFYYATWLEPPDVTLAGWYLPPTWAIPAPPPDGNAGTGYDSLPQEQTAKNTIVVGAIHDVTSDPYTKAQVDGSMTSFSSWGPTDDGRIGVDLVANGIALTSADDSADNAYASISGTSQSSPNVAGTAVLLVEHYNDTFGSQPNSATTKGALIHTAFDAGNTGPDYAFGWGLADGAAAAQFLTDAATTSYNWVIEGDYTGSELVYDFLSPAGAPLKATLVWTDPAPATLPGSGLDDPTSVLVNDLDLWITDWLGNTYYPWTLDPNNPGNPAVRTALNSVDNTVQVLIDSVAAAGKYQIHVGGSLDPLYASQDFSLLFSGVPEPASIAIWGLFTLVGLVVVRRMKNGRPGS